ncbi:pentatricopeptide repeat-containing protein At5g66500, mitochondrial [Fagus crenata]
MSTCYRSLRSLYFPAKSIQTVLSKNLHTHLFDETPHRDLYSLNSLLASYVRNGNALASWALFRDMHSTRSDLNAYTFTPVLGACSALSLSGPQRGKQVHGLMIKTGTEIGTVTKTALMDMYSKYGFLGDSVKVFDEMEFRDIVTWNALLSSFLRVDGLAEEALGVFEAMRKEGVEVSEFTLCSVLKACALLKAFRQGKQVHGMVVVMGRDLVVLGTALIDFYSAVGCIEEGIKVFSSLHCRKDDVMCNSLISGCVRNQKYEEAFSIMCMMKPNVVALTSALAACSENSDLWIGKQHGTTPTAAVWAALLNACSHNLDVKRGEFAANHLLQLEPNKAGNYVLISNFYAAIGRWDSVEELRSIMSTKGLVKDAGSSSITVTCCHVNAVTDSLIN